MNRGPENVNVVADRDLLPDLIEVSLNLKPLLSYAT